MIIVAQAQVLVAEEAVIAAEEVLREDLPEADSDNFGNLGIIGDGPFLARDCICFVDT